MLKFSNGEPAGQLMTTCGIDATCYDIMPLVERHLAGDWGDVGCEGEDANTAALRSKGQILSSYKIDGTEVWVMTDAGHDVTTVLLPDES